MEVSNIPGYVVTAMASFISAGISAVMIGMHFKGKIEQTITNHEDRLDVVEEEVRAMPSKCHDQKSEILTDLRREIPLLISTSIGQFMMSNMEKMVGMKEDTSDRITALRDEMREELYKIQRMMDRRSKSDPYVSERRGHDEPDS